MLFGEPYKLRGGWASFLYSRMIFLVVLVDLMTTMFPGVLEVYPLARRELDTDRILSLVMGW